jgi:hypothetical protein
MLKISIVSLFAVSLKADLLFFSLAGAGEKKAACKVRKGKRKIFSAEPTKSEIFKYTRS